MTTSTNELLSIYDKLVETFRQHRNSGRALIDEEQYMYLYIHHSAAIEGNTFSAGETIEFLMSGKVFNTHKIMEHNELLDLQDAYQLMQQNVFTKQPLVESVLLDYHYQMVKRTNPPIAGKWKTESNYTYISDGTLKAYPSPETSKILVVQAISRLVENTNAKKHPLLIASQIHYDIAVAHPFADGNGRVSRLAMEQTMLEHKLPSLFISKNKRLSYLKVLEQSQKNNNPNEFHNFFISHGIETLREQVNVLQQSKPRNTSFKM